ncbi:MAG: long-chain fatty acid--CoA ligase [Candidatus Cloacimonadota bacterium]|nr:MAG: long-chain fatty acid--CoA ligase [Candidatus Cloacimonadota bacterium]
MRKLIKSSNKTAILWNDEKITYRQICFSAERYAQFIPEKTEFISIFAANSPEWIYAFYACWLKNAVPVPIDFTASKEDVVYILDECRPEIIYTDDENLPKLKDALNEVDYSPIIKILTDSPKATGSGNYDPDISYKLEDTAVIIYTSGTTGNPKGVMLSYKNIFTNIDAVSVDVPIFTPKSTVFSILPFHHVLPLMGTVVAPLYVGCKISLCASLKGPDIIKTLKSHKATIIIGVPRLYKMIEQGILNKLKKNKAGILLFRLAKQINSPFFSKTVFKSINKTMGGRVKYLVSGGAALDREVNRNLTALGFSILEGFGMTETAPMITFTRPGEYCVGSAGRALPNLEMKIVNGEILVRGDNIMKGYYKRPDETAEIIKDGWLHTGDLGHLDEKERLFITGRKKEIIVLPNGKNINPERIENKLEKDPVIKEIGIFLKDNIMQAVVLPDLIKIREKSISKIDDFIKSQVIKPYNESVAPYKKIMKLHLIDKELPKTKLGKLRRFMLPELIEYKEKKKTKDFPKTEEYRLIADFIEKQTDQTVNPEDHFEIDLALDSLDKVNLLVFVNSAFGIDMSEEKMMDFHNAKLLSEYCAEEKQKIDPEDLDWEKIIKGDTGHLEIRESKSIVFWKKLSKIFFKIIMKLKVEGIENIPDTPVIFAANHQSVFDAFLLVSEFPDKLIKNTYFYAKKKHLKSKLMSNLANNNNVIVLDIHSDVKESILKLAEVLKSGKNVIIFPEGTRTVDGKIGHFKKTFSILSSELNIPILPAVINGAFKVLPGGSRFPKISKEVNVKFLKPVYPENHTYESLKNLVYDIIDGEIEH